MDPFGFDVPEGEEPPPYKSPLPPTTTLQSLAQPATLHVARQLADAYRLSLPFLAQPLCVDVIGRLEAGPGGIGGVLGRLEADFGRKDPEMFAKVGQPRNLQF